MVGRTRLYQKTGSPLIQGRSRRRAVPPWLVALLIVAAIALLVWAYVAFVR
jgi:hypothetical protein